MILALKDALGDAWNEELEKAWGEIFTIVKDTMISDNYEPKVQADNVDLTKPPMDDLDADLAGIGAESGIDYNQSVETKGMNLGENIDDVVNKSVAMTEMVKLPGSDDKLYDKNNEKFEKYTDINED